MATPPLPCRFARLVAHIILIRTGTMLGPQEGCADQATHRVRVDLPEPGVLTSLTATVCVWHAEQVRQGGYGLVFPAVPIPDVDLNASAEHQRHADVGPTRSYLST